MDPATNPFSPGAGTPPPELAGRAALLDDARVAIARAKGLRSARSQLLLGLRGVGKTVLLNRVEALAESEGCRSVALEAPEDKTLAEMLAPKLRAVLLKLSMLEAAKERARRALAVLRAFASVFKVGLDGIDFGVEPALGSADSGNLELDLPEILLATAEAAKAGSTALVLLVDEVQYLGEQDLAALIVAIHKVGQKQLPVVLFGAGLPQLAALAGEAKSYAERLFDYPSVGALPVDAARDAIAQPLKRAGVAIEERALRLIVERTEGYPYFLQEWGAHVWNVARASPITKAEVVRATDQVLERLDAGFFRVRLDRLTQRERDHVRAMASLGPGSQRSGEIAKALGIQVTTAGPLRNGLIRKGMIYSPGHGDTAFTVPMFDSFLLRTMPGWDTPSDVQPRGRRRRRREGH